MSPHAFFNFIVHAFNSQNTADMKAEHKTIEGELFGALVRAGAVSQDNANDPVKVRSIFNPLAILIFARSTLVEQPVQMQESMLLEMSYHSR